MKKICEIRITCQHMKPDGILRIHMSTYRAMLRNINGMSAYETIIHIINSYVNIGNLVAEHEPIINI